MNQATRPDWWDDDDSAISELLNRIPVPDRARFSALEYLIENCNSLGSIGPASPDHVSRPVVSNAEPALKDLLALESRVESSTQTRRIVTLRTWMAVSVMAASVVMGLFWWSSSAHLAPPQLMAICHEQILQVSEWKTPEEQLAQAELSRFSELLRKYLAVATGGEIGTQAFSRTSVSSSGRIWKIPIANQHDLYVLEFHSPRQITNLDARLQLLNGLSNGWSQAAVVTGDRLLVFMSKDDVRRSLRMLPLA